MKKSVLVLAIGILLAVPVAMAETVEITGVWGNVKWTEEPVPTAAQMFDRYGVTLAEDYNPHEEKYSSNGTAIWWGTNSTGQLNGDYSGFAWDSVESFDDVVVGSAFELGTFTHHNYVIDTWSAIASADLFLQFKAFDNPEFDFTITFNNDETPFYYENGEMVNPPDKVTIPDNLFPYNEEIELEGLQYYFTILGFSQDGGNTFKYEYTTLEEQLNSTSLWAVITRMPVDCTDSDSCFNEPDIPEVPEPTSVALLISGLSILGVAAWRKRTKK